MPISDAERGVVPEMAGRSVDTIALDNKLFSGFDYQVIPCASRFMAPLFYILLCCLLVCTDSG